MDGRIQVEIMRNHCLVVFSRGITIPGFLRKGRNGFCPSTRIVNVSTGLTWAAHSPNNYESQGGLATLASNANQCWGEANHIRHTEKVVNGCFSCPVLLAYVLIPILSSNNDNSASLWWDDV